ncbi:beta-lactamase class A [Tamaricihabitans halophyticus]|uniref:Beta-lactamase class A n=1 Tax=Tamaricihabitans halophyticus TaxID=1262583 RepID=A0A4R2QXM4_9PSEU|nr:serine hydrolase [Tamaricihabitans halophyticus]TCP51841.1 beta-lactamase class A [Tamaricihabitans halophyticus]
MTDEIIARAEEVGVSVWMHARAIDGTASLGIDATTPVVLASVFKVPLAVELANQAERGRCDLAEQVTVPAGPKVASPYGLATFQHPATLSLDALATLMIGISDNVATDVVFARIGKRAVRELCDRLGLADTAIEQDCAELLGTIGADLGFDYADDERALTELSPTQLRSLRALRPEQTCRSTALDMTALLSMIWRDEAAGPAACANVRRWLGLQVWPHRLRSGFHTDEVRISGKTGTLPTIRNEVGVVEYANGERFAVAVFTEAIDARAQAPERDGFIGFAAARAVEELRRQG